MNERLPPPAQGASSLGHGGDSLAFERFIELIPDAIVLVRTGGRIVAVNEHAERLFGYPRNDLLGAPIEALVPQRLRGGH